jgi:hypothetical protein
MPQSNAKRPEQSRIGAYSASGPALAPILECLGIESVRVDQDREEHASPELDAKAFRGRFLPGLELKTCRKRRQRALENVARRRTAERSFIPLRFLVALEPLSLDLVLLA